MMPIVQEPVAVTKEMIDTLTFPKEEVLSSQGAILQRKLFLEKAAVLGNDYKMKITIVFEDDRGLKQVETTVWDYSEDNVFLKGGVVIPVNRIREIRTY